MHLEKESELNHIEWAKWKKDLLTYGTYDPNDHDKLSKYQKKWTADTLNTLKKLQND